MKCEACGQDFGVTHNCPGVITATPSQEEVAPFPAHFAPLYYLRLAFNIARWDDVSIRRASHDSNAGIYGTGVWAVAVMVILGFTALPQFLRTNQSSGLALTIGLGAVLIGGLVIMGVITLIQLGSCHLIAKWFFGASGTFVGVMRPLLLGWFVNVLILIPVVGILAAGIAWTAVLMLVFEEVDGIGRLQAFAISAGINLLFMALQLVG